MEFINRAQVELAEGLRSIMNEPRNGVADYHYNYARYINNTLHSFLVLCGANEVESARILIRPALEVALRLEALRQFPETMVQIARWEHDENKKAANALKPEEKAATDAIFAEYWVDFLRAYRISYPNHQINESPLSAHDAARITGILNIHDLYYRFYCRYSHGAMSTLLGHWDDFADQDANVAGHCLMVAVAAISDLGASLPNKESLEKEYLSFRAPPAST